jgi:hypothetical protein
VKKFEKIWISFFADLAKLICGRFVLAGGIEKLPDSQSILLHIYLQKGSLIAATFSRRINPERGLPKEKV